MAKQRTIPTTKFVPPFPTEKDVEKTMWFQSVASYCGGSQSVKANDDIYSTRTGATVRIEGQFTKGAYFNMVELPVAPRLDGFVQICDTSGNMSALLYSKGDKTIDITSLTDGTYYINGAYFAQLKENI